MGIVSKIMAFFKVVCTFTLLGLINTLPSNVAEASPAVPVHFEQIVVEHEEIAHFSVAGARIHGADGVTYKENIKQITRYGYVDPRVNQLTLSICCKKPVAANGKVLIRAFDKYNFEGLELETDEKEIRALDGEKLKLDYRYTFTARVKSIVVELFFKYISKEGKERINKAVYNLTI